MDKNQIMLSLISGLIGAILVPLGQFLFKKYYVDNKNRKIIENFVKANGGGKISTFYINNETNIHPDDIFNLGCTSKVIRVSSNDSENFNNNRKVSWSVRAEAKEDIKRMRKLWKMQVCWTNIVKCGRLMFKKLKKN